MIELLHIDCMEYMKGLPDNAFDLAIVDPPYLDNYAAMQNLNTDMKGKKAKVGKYHYNSLENAAPKAEYFEQLFRVSKHQIIWGWNYYVQYLNTCPSYIVWDKDNSGNFADCETAWCSIKGAARVFKYRWNGMLQENMSNKEIRIHPTQKPKALYAWLLKNYAKEGWKIFDSHLGSASIAIACDALGFQLTACEIDEKYFNDAKRRFDKETDLPLFNVRTKS